MVFITGDIHGDAIRRLNVHSFPEQKEMNKNDTVIICGDFGIIWQDSESANEQYELDWLESKSFTTVFCDGNHDNFPSIYKYPVKEWNGGLVHEIRPHVLHLIRGEVYTIEGKKFFAFGGASSHDISDGILDPADFKTKEEFKAEYKRWDKANKMFRVKGVSWWSEELPTEEEMQHGLDTLKAHNNKVDFIITHCLPQEVASVFSMGLYKSDILTNYFNEIAHTTEFNRWFCGHYHVDRDMYGKFIMLFEQIVRVL